MVTNEGQLNNVKANDKAKTTPNANSRLKRPDEYGVLHVPNIGLVLFGEYEFDTWYGNSAYFNSNGDLELGIDTIKAGGSQRRRTPLAPQESLLWLDKLCVCEYCFKYTADAAKMTLHRMVCPLKKPFPPLGRLVYSDTKAPYLIKHVRGYTHELFCQNLSLFGKLFLDDKSVYYNVDCFDFYVLYGFDSRDEEISGSVLRKNFKPMGFFSHEVNSWDADNNLACICVFPPFQRLHLGQLLIEFLYAMALVTPNMARLGPEFPLSPYGKISYLRFWAKRLASIITTDLGDSKVVTLQDLGNATGFRKEDILLALEYMDILEEDTKSEEILVNPTKLNDWCRSNNFDASTHLQMLNPDCILL